MSLPEFSVKNPVLVNMIMIIVFLFGIYTVINIPKEEMPAVDFGAFYIITNYRGVSPQEIEQQITKKIEDQIGNIEGIDYISSTSREGRSRIYIQMLPNADTDKAWDDINTAMQKVTDLPDDASTPNVIRLNMREVNSICTISMGGDFSGNTLRELADNFKDELLDIPYISKVEVSGTRDRQIWIDVDPSTLDAYGLTLNDITSTIKSTNLNIPGGTVTYGKSEIIVRTTGEFTSLNQISNLIIKSDKYGNAVRIDDVAEVKDTLEKRTTIGKLNGKPAVNLFVYKSSDGDIIKVMKDVRAKVTEFKSSVPGLDMQIRNDGSINVKNNMRVLSTNALIGIVFVFFTLWAFIGWRNALFATWGIPFSFLLAFILMKFFNITINNLSLFALILVSGMIVDDAIIILENIHRHIENGVQVREAAVKGAKEIMWPVIAAVTTTIVAFIPMLMMQGKMGKFMKVFPIVVTFALVASLFESLLILPSHVAELTKKPKTREEKPHKLHDWLLKKYRKIIIFALGHRWIIIGIVTVALILSGMAVMFRVVKFEFFPRRTPKTITLTVHTPSGYSLEETDKIVSNIENYILNMKEKDDIEAVVSTVGRYREKHRWKISTSSAEIRMDLVDPDKLTYSVEDIRNSIRKYLSSIPDVYTYSFKTGRGGPPTGNDIELRIMGDNLNKLKLIGDYIIDKLKKIPGTTDFETSFLTGEKELNIIPKYDNLAINSLTVQDVAYFINSASYGTVASKYRGEGLTEYDIIVKNNDSVKDNIEILKNLKIRSKNGLLIPLKDVVDFTISKSYSEINHYNKKRVLTITGNTTYYNDKGKVVKRTPDEVTQILKGNKLTGEKGLLSDFTQRFPGYRLEYGGSAEEQQKTYNSLYFALIIALFLVYTILGTQFKSYVQPIIVMTTIPFAFIGVVFGLFVTRLPFSLNTMVAVVALIGIVVNDSLVLVDFVNREREQGIDRWNSLINAGMIRLRPIILTTVTTIAGFMPFILSTSSAATFWKPMAVAIAFGLAFSTALTLIVIPVIYSIVDSFFGKLHLTRFDRHITFKEAIKNKETGERS